MKKLTVKEKRIIVMQAMLKDKELQGGGIFQKGEYYAKKYGFTMEEIVNMEVAIGLAIQGYSVRNNG